MQKGRIIKDIIGKVLEPEGFVYDKKIKDWGFIKEFKNNKGEIARQVVKFYPSRYEKKLFMDINCFSGGFDSYRINRFVPGCINDGINYSKEEEFMQVIETYADILKQYGLKLLKEIEVPKRSAYTRQEDDDKLFHESDSLAHKFITEQHIDMDRITIEDAVGLIRDMVLSRKSEPFEDIRELFLELAAFYGKVVSKTYPCKWVMEDMETHIICTLEIESKTTPSLFVTNIIHLAWKFGENKLERLLI